MRRAARVDANHADIIAAFRSFGFSVADTSRLGSGFPDCVIARNGITGLVEIKDGSKPASARRLTDDEERFRMNWNGRWELVESFDDVMRIAQSWNQ